MAKLSPAQKERIKFHLGINDNTPSGDVYWADIQLAKIYQDQTIHLLKANLDGYYGYCSPRGHHRGCEPNHHQHGGRPSKGQEKVRGSR